MTDAILQALAAHGDTWCLDLNAAGRFLAEMNDRPKRRMPKAAGTVAVIPVHGVLTQRGMWGDGGTDQLARTIEAAVSHHSVSGVILDVDSPGGSSHGLQEFSDKVFAMRGKGKPIVALANPMAASAALWAGSSADRFAVTPSGEVGSLGVWSLHLDYSELLAAEGIKPTFVFAGKHKVDGNPYEPLSAVAKAHWQESVDDTYSHFVEAMARNRGTSKAKVRSDFGEGRMLLPQQALSAGMVDRVATLDDLLGEMNATGSVGIGMAASITEHLCAVWEDKPAPVAMVNHVEALRKRRERERARA